MDATPPEGLDEQTSPAPRSVIRSAPITSRPSAFGAADGGSTVASGGSGRSRSGRRDLSSEVLQRLTETTVEVVLDVGANVGRSAVAFASAFPGARVHAVEPVQAANALLREAVAEHPNVTVHDVAFSDGPGTGFLRSSEADALNRIVDPERAGADALEVRLRGGDEFCAEHAIDHVGILKVDTVGHDLAVLRGFHGMLGRQDIDIVEVEAGLYTGNDRRVPLERFRGYLEPMGYELFGIYAPARGHDGLPVLARAHFAFISGASALANRRRRT